VKGEESTGLGWPAHGVDSELPAATPSGLGWPQGPDGMSPTAAKTERNVETL
jgi:hypothetical protein